MANAAGDKVTLETASIKLRRQKDIYEDFCKAAGTYTEYERTFVAGYNRRLAGKTGAVTKKQREFDKARVRLTDGGNGSIINTDERKKHFLEDLHNGKVNTNVDKINQTKHTVSSEWKNNAKQQLNKRQIPVLMYFWLFREEMINYGLVPKKY